MTTVNPHQPRTLPVSEVFTTLQGEGPAAGRPATFIRFGGCNLSCSWCDTPYTWDARRFDLRREFTPTEPADLLERVHAPMVVITGGEPLLHQKNPAWIRLLEDLKITGHTVHLETNGTIAPTEQTARDVDLAVVSPKLDYVGAGTRTGVDPVVPSVLFLWAGIAVRGGAVLKVVVQTEAHCTAAVALAEAHGWPASAVWLMPEGTTPEALTSRWPMVAEFAASVGVNATHRLHVLAWNDQRGH